MGVGVGYFDIAQSTIHNTLMFVKHETSLQNKKTIFAHQKKILHLVERKKDNKRLLGTINT